MPELDIELKTQARHYQSGRDIELVSMGSVPNNQVVRTIRLIGCNLSCTLGATVFISFGSFRVPVYVPVAASVIYNITLDIYDNIVPVEVFEFAIDQVPPGFTGAFYLLTIGH